MEDPAYDLSREQLLTRLTKTDHAPAMGVDGGHGSHIGEQTATTPPTGLDQHYAHQVKTTLTPVCF